MEGTLPGLLIVEDEKNTRDGLRLALEESFEVYLAADQAAALNILEAESIAVMLCDIRLGGDNGLELLARAQALPQPPVTIMMTAYGSVDNAVEAMRRGAYDFVTKPFNLEKLELLLKRATRTRNVEHENRQLKQQLHRKFGVERLLGNSPVMKAVIERIQQVADSRASVLVQGESGTGKELAANALHQLSSRREKPLVIVHCAALSPQLLESELFGHEKGSFTGATERRIGRFEEAHHGTIFLDEIGEIDSATQVKLLRAIGERTIQRVGGNQNIAVDTRIITATNRNLEQMVREGTFREDLYFRLNVVSITMPPLRERKEDLPLLIQVFLKEFAKENGKPVPTLHPEAQACLLRYDWPGNVRELRMAMEHGVVLARDGQITVSDLPERLLHGSTLLSGDGQPLGEAVQTLNLEELERATIIRAIKLCNGSRTEAALKLGLSRRTLHRKLKLYQLEHL